MVAQNVSSVGNWYLNSLRDEMVRLILHNNKSQKYRLYSKEPALQHGFNAAIDKLIWVHGAEISLLDYVYFLALKQALHSVI